MGAKENITTSHIHRVSNESNRKEIGKYQFPNDAIEKML